MPYIDKKVADSRIIWRWFYGGVIPGREFSSALVNKPPKKSNATISRQFAAIMLRWKKNCRKCPVISAAISEAHPEGILGQFWNTLWGPPTIQELMYFHFWTWKLANLEGDMFGYRTVCYLCDTIKKYNTIIYVITNIIYIYSTYTPPDYQHFEWW